MITLDERTKRILLIVGLSVAVIGIGIALWFVFFKKEASVIISEEERAGLPESGSLPTRKEAA
ncbi:MAG: hypothetical protein AAB912_01955, partial [Patescibacteria group bacterium]